MAELATRSLVIDDPDALISWLAGAYPDGLQINVGFVAHLADTGLTVQRDGDPSRFDLIAPDGALVPGIHLGPTELPQGEGVAEPEEIDA